MPLPKFQKLACLLTSKKINQIYDSFTTLECGFTGYNKKKKVNSSFLLFLNANPECYQCDLAKVILYISSFG